MVSDCGNTPLDIPILLLSCSTLSMKPFFSNECKPNVISFHGFSLNMLYFDIAGDSIVTEILIKTLSRNVYLRFTYVHEMKFFFAFATWFDLKFAAKSMERYIFSSTLWHPTHLPQNGNPNKNDESIKSRNDVAYLDSSYSWIIFFTATIFNFDILIFSSSSLRNSIDIDECRKKYTAWHVKWSRP